VGFKSRNCDLPLSASEPVELASLFPSPFDRLRDQKITLPFDKLRVRKIYSTIRQAQGPEFLLRPEGFHSRPVSLSNWLAFSLTLRQAQGPKNLLNPSTGSGTGIFIAASKLPLSASEPVELASLFPHPSTGSGAEKFTLPFDRLRGRKIYSTLRQAQGPEFNCGH
jgi:hypothetical protein